MLSMHNDKTREPLVLFGRESTVRFEAVAMSQHFQPVTFIITNPFIEYIRQLTPRVTVRSLSLPASLYRNPPYLASSHQEYPRVPIQPA